MKKCSNCKLELDYVCFCKKTNTPDGYSYFCKQCASKKAREYYHKSNNKDKIVKRNKMRMLSNKKFVFNYLSTHPCVDCGESRPECLDFDHQQDKKMAVSLMLAENFGLETIQKEISKCQVRCSNCHRVKTAREQNWYFFMASPAGLEPA